MTSIAKM